MKKKVIIGIALVITLIAGFVGWRFYGGQEEQTASQTFTLKKSDLLDAVRVSGTVNSSKTENVYSKVTNYPIKEVYYVVGDKVKAGAVLAELDTAALELDIRQTELNIANAQASLKNENSSNQYNLQTALNNLKTASLELESSQQNYQQIKQLYGSGGSTKEELLNAESNLKKAQVSYQNAQISVDNIKTQNTTSTKNDIEIQKVSLEKLKKTLWDAKIVAPIDGTVTLVNAKQDADASGLLFVIEDTDNLVVDTAIGEYDISLVKAGQEVVVKTDTTGDKAFKGSVSKIAPTSIKDASGNSTDSSNVEFDTEIALKDKDPNLKIGMNVRLSIKLEEKKDVYSVPYDAIVKEADGSQWIYVSESSSKGNESSKKIKVQTGMETDMYVEVMADGLQDGMKILINPKDNGKAAV